MKKLRTAFLSGCALFASLSAWANIPILPNILNESLETQLLEYQPHELNHFTTAKAKLSKHTAAAISADDSEYTEWKNLGRATISDNDVTLISDFEQSINSWCREGEDSIKFATTTVVMERKLKADTGIVQLKFCKFLGYNDIYINLNSRTWIGESPTTDLGLSLPEWLKESYNAEIIEVCPNVEFSPAKKTLTMHADFFLKDRNWRSLNFTYLLPDANENIGINDPQIKSGGTKSTDKSVTYHADLNGVDHIRYITKKISYDEYEYSLYDIQNDIANIIAGTTEFKETTSDVTINFEHGHGNYTALMLAMDADDNYLGTYNRVTCHSNLASEGKWESIGRGTWHYPSPQELHFASNFDFYFPTDKLEWEVEIEKRIDTDREIYRVVNPYTLECPLAESFYDLFEQLNNLCQNLYQMTAVYGDWYEDDTHWFEFELCENGTIDIDMDRWLAAFNSEIFILPETFNGKYYTFKDHRLTVKSTMYVGFSIVIDFPGYRGQGFDQSGDDNEALIGSVGPNVAKIIYTIIPASEINPSKEEFDAIAKEIINEPNKHTTHTVICENQSDSVTIYLPYKEYLKSDSWIVVVPVDKNGEAFDYLASYLPIPIEIKDVTMEETLLSPLTMNRSLFGKFTGLTLCKRSYPHSEIDTYTFPNPYYSNDPGWYSYFNFNIDVKECPDWVIYHYKHDNKIYINECQAGVTLTDHNYCFLRPIFDSAYKEGDKFYFHQIGSELEGYGGIATSFNDCYFVIDISSKESSSVTDIKTDDASDAEVEFYDLQGRRITNPSNGFYIRRQGSNVTKTRWLN